MSTEQEAAPQAPDSEALPVDHTAVFDRARELVRAKLELDRLDELVDAQKKIKAAAEAYLLEAFANEPALGGLKVDGYTIYSRRTLYANAPDKAQAYEALIAAGLEDFATRGFNATSVSALFREWDKNGEQPPAALGDVFTVAETYKIGMTKSG